ncbi:TBC1 domain family member 30 isoform X4 [Poeciliopsis prolifica]|uniref:TBC1 domain family member 30 isoform X4 n=1 Tax=Poeciliopsis prolifica TaxID=188132 RepID=UPI00241451FC|nr:TBC1 domain family member 30 isoform X4 [Poeciliopsis prolifica]
MAERLKPSREELLEVTICDRSVGSEEDSGVFSHSTEDFCGFQQWTRNDTSSSSPSSRPAEPAAPRSSIVDCLLVELYDAFSGGGGRRTADSWDSSTGSGSDTLPVRSSSGCGFLQELQEGHTRRLQVTYLAQKDLPELRSIVQEVKHRSGLQSSKLLRQLKRRDRLVHKRQKNYDVITACLQAVSQKRRVDTRLKFTIEPSLGNSGFQQWYDALKAVARLPTGIPREWRKKVWLTLADRYLHSISIDWDKTLRFTFNERSNPDDDSLGIQIVKDLHRTGCSSYCGQEGEQDRVVLKRVLLAYARWNKSVGYCQGFNVLAALILEVTEGNESDALKVMIYLIDKVLPESYFANNLRALSVDMAVFRDLLRLKLPRLSQHLHHLQKAANREAGGSYEPPLTNVFTMQWFLTMFATCLPAPTVLKIWDSVFFEGSEVLFRAALAIWERLGERIEDCQTADEFYSTMGVLTQEMLEQNLLHPAQLMQDVYSMAPFPFPQLAELREKYTYNITPFPTAAQVNAQVNASGPSGWDSEEDADVDDDESVAAALGCLGPLGGLLAPELQRYQKHLKDQRVEQGSIAELSPGAVGGAAAGSGRAEHQAAVNSMMLERMSTDITALKKQYGRIKRRQQQQATRLCIRTDKCPATRVLASQLNPSSAVINHLLLGRKPRGPSRTFRPGSAGPPGPGPPGPGSPCRRRRGSSSTGSPGSRRGSPWRNHARQHRGNPGRVRARIRVPDTEEREDDDDEEEGESGCEEEVKVEEVEVRLDSLDLENQATQNSLTDPEPEPDEEASRAAPPDSDRPGEPNSAGSDGPAAEPSTSSSSPGPPLPPSSSSPGPPLPPSSSSAPRQPLFSPFPSIKQPRKSLAARNLGLYGPTSRTPTVHFPQLSRSLNRSSAAGATGRR